MFKIFVDADGCPVKAEVYKVAQRHNLKVILVANKAFSIPLNQLFELKVVPGEFDAADDWIVENILANDIAVTGDIPLADRCLKKGAFVLGHKGHEFTPDNIGDTMASREIQTLLRQMGQSGGPTAMTKTDRSKFLAKLDQMVHSAKRN